MRAITTSGELTKALLLIFHDIPEVNVIHVAAIIDTKSRKEHIETLYKIMEKLQDVGLTLILKNASSSKIAYHFGDYSSAMKGSNQTHQKQKSYDPLAQHKIKNR